MSWKLGLGSAQGFTGEWREGLVKRTRLVWETYFLTICEVALESAHSGHSESAESMTANGGRKGSESWLTCMGSVQKDVSLLLSSRRSCIFRCNKIIKIKHQDQQLHIIRVVWWCYKSHWWVLIIVPRVRFPRASISLCYQVFQAVQAGEGGFKAWEGLYWKCSVPMSLSLVFLWLSLSLLSLIFVIVLCVNLTSPHDMQTSGYRLFLRMFPQKVSIWISKLNKGNCLPQCGWISPSPLRPEWNKMVGEGRIGALSLCLTVKAETLVFCPWCSWHSGLTEIYTMGSTVLRLLNCMKSFPRFPARRWKINGLFSLHSHTNQFRIISLSLSLISLLVLCFLRSLPNTIFHLCEVGGRAWHTDGEPDHRLWIIPELSLLRAV